MEVQTPGKIAHKVVMNPRMAHQIVKQIRIPK
jgi:hypothetical protein